MTTATQSVYVNAKSIKYSELTKVLFHEFKNPLYAFMSILELMEEGHLPTQIQIKTLHNQCFEYDKLLNIFNNLSIDSIDSDIINKIKNKEYNLLN